MTHQRFIAADDSMNSRYVLLDTQPDGTPETSDPVRIGLIDYVDAGPNKTERILFHTEVDPQYSGQGLASMLVQHAIDDLLNQGKAIVPACPYVAGWLPRNPQYAGQTMEPQPEHLEAIKHLLKNKNTQ